MAAFGSEPRGELREALADLGARAVANSAPYADNTSAAVIRWLGA
jgi:hypothetical protein